MLVTPKAQSGVTHRPRWAVTIPLAAAALGLAAAGCGSAATHQSAPGNASLAGMHGPAGGVGTAPTPSTAPGTVSPAPTGPAAIAVAQTSLGSILTDSKGLTVYLFEKDGGTTSACNGPCAAAWPPVTDTPAQPTAGGGANQALLGTTIRTDGATQLTYAGHPLYRFAGDQKPGDTNGQGLRSFGAGWDALRPSGQKVENGG
jgi:predicted lipoprotein with Yx(FWY)xxD motif